jgi:hypothetical protein
MAMEHLKGAELAEMIESATVDAYGQDQQLTGLFDRLEECLPAEFETTVLGVQVTVKSITYMNGVISADCVRGEYRQAISLLDLPLPDPPPEGWEWIAAYRYWISRH